ncbi:MAG: AcvB/VirJ family lysyl-phosphatidylglycerol hydrolase, partial [Hyphomonadaceae bacterium]
MPAHRRLAPVLVFMAIALFGARPADAMDFFARTARTCLPAEISNLPIVAVEPSPAVSADRFVIWISGDGGWSSLERDITQTTAQQGVPTAALNTLLYFARKRSAQQTAREIERM